MANPNSIVGLVEGIQSGGVTPQGVELGVPLKPTVVLSNDQFAVLRSSDPDDPDRRLLETLNRIRHPAYVVVRPGTHEIESVSIPVVGRVLDMESMPSGDIHVRLDSSSARHVVRPSTTGRDEILELARRSFRSRAIALVIADRPDDHEIIDVHLTEPSFTPAFLVARRFLSGPAAIERISTVGVSDADDLVLQMQGVSCNPGNPAAGCIPFQYPDSGCWARAHRMWQLMKEAGLEAGKLWIFGGLRAATSNHPHCRIDWFSHVAPVLRIKGREARHLRVIDPSLFPRASVSPRTWKNAQGDRCAKMVVTEPALYFSSSRARGRVEDDPEETERWFVKFRAKLAERNPPYRCAT